jgi:NADH-quinone oxidoreductase subunit E
LVQEENGGSLNTELIDQVADYLEMSRSAAYEVATFYSMYHLQPQGRHTFSVCTNISCMLRGSDEIVAHLEKRLGIKLGETTADGRYTLREVECLAACAAAPALQLDERDYYENLDPQKIDALLDRLNQKEAS